MRPLIILLALLPVPLIGAEIPITAAPLAQLVIHPERSAPATVESLNNADLSAEINARVEAIAVRVGDLVTSGDELVRLDCREHRSRLAAQQASLAQLEAQRRLALSQHNRARNLNRDRNISEEEVDRRAAELAVVDAQIGAQREAVRQAELNVERCSVRAPFRAVVTERLTDVGTVTAPGSPLLRLVQLDELEVSARVRPDEADEGATSQSINFVYLGKRYPVTIRRVLPVVDPSTRTLDLRLSFRGETPPSGASGRLVWRASGSYLPAELMVRRGERLGVFVLSEDRARFHPLPQAIEGQPARVEPPLDDPIILEGRQRLQDGDAVRSTEPNLP